MIFIISVIAIFVRTAFESGMSTTVTPKSYKAFSPESMTPKSKSNDNEYVLNLQWGMGTEDFVAMQARANLLNYPPKNYEKFGRSQRYRIDQEHWHAVRYFQNYNADRENNYTPQWVDRIGRRVEKEVQDEEQQAPVKLPTLGVRKDKTTFIVDREQLVTEQNARPDDPMDDDDDY